MRPFAALNRVWVSAKRKEKATRNPGKHRRVTGLAMSRHGPRHQRQARRWYGLNRMTKRARVVRANHRLAVLLPRSAVQALGIGAGDSVEVTAINSAVVIRRDRRSLSLNALVRRITQQNRHSEIRWHAMR